MSKLDERIRKIKNKEIIPLCEGDVHKYHLCGESWVKDIRNENDEIVARKQYVMFVCENCGHTKYMPLQHDNKSNPDG